MNGGVGPAAVGKDVRGGGKKRERREDGWWWLIKSIINYIYYNLGVNFFLIFHKKGYFLYHRTICMFVRLQAARPACHFHARTKLRYHNNRKTHATTH
jgi:hypothetical protein